MASKPTAQAVRRISREWADMEANKEQYKAQGFSAGPISENDLSNWKAELIGPANTPYQGGVFKLDIRLPPDYPFTHPKVKFITKIYHPDVIEDIDEEEGGEGGANQGDAGTSSSADARDAGSVCLPLLRPGEWKPSNKIVDILAYVLGLLSDPDIDDAIQANVAKVYKDDYAKFEDTAKRWTRKYAQ